MDPAPAFNPLAFGAGIGALVVLYLIVIHEMRRRDKARWLAKARADRDAFMAAYDGPRFRVVDRPHRHHTERYILEYAWFSDIYPDEWTPDTPPYEAKLVWVLQGTFASRLKAEAEVARRVCPPQDTVIAEFDHLGQRLADAA